MNLAPTITTKLQELLDQGLTIPEIAEATGISVAIVTKSLASNCIKEVVDEKDIAKLINNIKPDCIRILHNIALGSENDGARVKACETLLKYNELVSINNNGGNLEKMIDDMRRVVENHQNKIININSGNPNNGDNQQPQLMDSCMAGAI